LLVISASAKEKPKAVKKNEKPKMSQNNKPGICAVHIPFYSLCGGIQVFCGEVTIAYWCDNYALFEVRSWSACGAADLCDGIFGVM
jgi:hypothetical protein